MINNVRQHIIDWNNKFPLDKWWRTKHNIAFGSEQHLAISQYDILFEYIEDELFKQISEDQSDDNNIPLYKANGTDVHWLNPSANMRMRQDDVNIDDITSLHDIKFDDEGNIII